jgi:hypothetical protein
VAGLIRLLLAAVILLVSPATGAVDLYGYVGFEERYFPQSPLLEPSRDSQPSLLFESQLNWQKEDDSFLLTAYGRLDEVDDERSHLDLREAKWLHRANDWDLEIGNALVFWGVTESQHLVDIINQRDSTEDITGDARLGQPMIHARYFGGSMILESFILPYFRERPFSAEPGRMRYPLTVDTDDARFESDQEQQHVDYALRASLTQGPLDMGLAWFRGTGREPILVLSDDGTELIPYYPQLTQFSLDLQVTLEESLWKLEARHRRSGDDHENAFVAGVELLYPQAFGGNTDLSAMVEYNWDERGDDATTPYQDDLFTGIRLTFNDTASSDALIGIITDLEHDSRFGRIRISTRYGERLRIGFEAYWFQSGWQNDAIYTVRNDDHVILTFKYYY